MKARGKQQGRGTVDNIKKPNDSANQHAASTDATYAQQIYPQNGTAVHSLQKSIVRMIASHPWPQVQVDRPAHRSELMRTELTLLGYVPVMPRNKLSQVLSSSRACSGVHRYNRETRVGLSKMILL